MIDRKVITSNFLCDVTSGGGGFQVANRPVIYFWFLCNFATFELQLFSSSALVYK